MLADAVQIQNLCDLRDYVYHALCEQNELEPGAFQLTQRILLRGKRPCGIHFCLHGPRSVKLIAIWETDGNTILFYSSSGERRQRIQLAASPTLRALAG